MIDDGWRVRLRAVIAERTKDIKKENYTTLAKKAGKGDNFVGQYVTSDRVPSLENLLILCEILNVSYIYILSGFEITPEEVEFVRIVSHLSPAARQWVRQTVLQMKLLEDQTRSEAAPAELPSVSD